MRVTTNTATGLLPVLAWGLALILLIAVLAALWAGNRWAQGTQAIKDRATQQQQIADLQRAAQTLRQQAAETAVQYHQAAARLNDIAGLLEQDRESQRKFDQRHAVELAALLRDRPDLRTGHAGDDVLRHWNQSNAGPGTGPAAAGDAAEPDPTVPGAASGAKRPVGNPTGQPRPGGKPVSRLPQRQAETDRGRAGLGTHGVELVLRSAGTYGPQATGVRQ